jgi:hypothetical protein
MATSYQGADSMQQGIAYRLLIRALDFLFGGPTGRRRRGTEPSTAPDPGPDQHTEPPPHAGQPDAGPEQGEQNDVVHLDAYLPPRSTGQAPGELTLPIRPLPEFDPPPYVSEHIERRAQDDERELWLQRHAAEQRRLQRQRRAEALLATVGIDIGPRTIHGVRMPMNKTA